MSVALRYARPTAARPFGLAAVGMALFLVMTALNSHNSRLLIVFLVIAACFAMASSSVAWLTAPLLLTEYSVANYMVPSTGTSMRLAIIGGTFVVAIIAIFRARLLHDGASQRVLVPTLAFIFIATAIDAMFSDAAYVFKYFRYQFIQLLTLLIFAAVIRELPDLKQVLWIVLGVAVAAALAGIWQHYDKWSAPYVMGNTTWISRFHGRSIGLMNSPVHLANHMLFALLPVIGILMAGPMRLDRLRTTLLGIVALLGFALYFTYTRSGLLAIAPGLFVAALCLRGSRRPWIVGAVLIGAVAGWAILGPLRDLGILGDRYYRDASNDNSAAGHLALLQVGTAVAMDHPILGIGREHFEAVSVSYLDVVDFGDAADRQAAGEKSIGRTQPHNDFLLVWISWGIGALVTYSLVIVGTLINCYQAARHNGVFIRGLAVGTAGGIVAYATNSVFHNYLDSSTFLWAYAGLSIALARLATAESRVARLVALRTPARLSRRFSGRLVEQPAF